MKIKVLLKLLIKPIRFLLISSMVLYLSGCFDSNLDQESALLPTNEPTPEFLMFIKPTGTKNIDDYDESRFTHFGMVRDIAVSFWAHNMGIAVEHQNWETIEQRVMLFLNGEEVSNETLTGGADGEKDGGLFRVSWAPELDPGYYQARFQISNDSGEVYTYSWVFLLEK